MASSGKSVPSREYGYHVYDAGLAGASFLLLASPSVNCQTNQIVHAEFMGLIRGNSGYIKVMGITAKWKIILR